MTTGGGGGGESTPESSTRAAAGGYAYRSFMVFSIVFSLNQQFVAETNLR
jgi:hypothetical protein